MLGKHKINTQARLSLSIFVLIVLVVAGYVLFIQGSTNGKHAYTTELAFANSNLGEIYLTDDAGKQISKATYLKFSHLDFQAVGPNGGILASANTAADNESFIFTRGSAIKTLSADSAKPLHAATLVQSSHQIFFVDEKTVILLSCPEPACLLQKFDLSSGTSTKLLNTGVKPSNQYSPNVYLAGYSARAQLAYVRVVNAQNKLGSSDNAVYEIDTKSAKVTRNFAVPGLASFTTSLSPDGHKLAYATNDAKNKTTINILDLNSKANQKISWDKGSLLNGPQTLKWSSDSSKLLTQTANIIIPGDVKAQTPAQIAYIDLASNSIKVIQQIKEPASETISGLGWLSNDTVIYQLKKSPSASSGQTTSKTVKQAITGAAATPLEVPSGDLMQVVFY